MNRTHGLHELKRAVSAQGMSAIDGRSKAARSVMEWRAALIGDLGGAESLSAQKTALVELAARTELFLSHIDSWLMTQPRLVNARSKSILPALRERQQLADSLVRTLAQLGLERVAKPVMQLREYIADHDREEKEPA